MAILAGLQVALPYAERHGIPRAKSGWIAFWTIILALIGGRLFYDLQSGAGYYFKMCIRDRSMSCSAS